MKKDFDNWNKKKKTIDSTDSAIIAPFHEREIWWCSIGLNVGDEQDGKNELFERPVLVIKKFNRGLAWVLPLSSKQKEGIYYFKINHEGKDFTVILSQLRLISTKRFLRRIWRIPDEPFAEIVNRVKNLFTITDEAP